MKSLHQKKIIIAVTGSIAAYKVAHLVRLLVKEGVEVKVIMTEASTQFITPLTLSTLSKNPVIMSFENGKTGVWNNHVELGLWADLILFAPCTANTLAKCSHGICDNFLTAVYFSAKCPVFFAPAMDLDMYLHPTTADNIQRLKSFGNAFIDATFGELASGLVGKGRMAEPEDIVNIIREHWTKDQDLIQETVLITAGPTYEALDPVRFIGNHSTGKMGFAIAESLAMRGAKVILVKGPTQVAPPQHPNIDIIDVTSADQMFDACHQHFDTCHAAVLAAAVADYKPKNQATQKIKKKSDEMSLELVKNKDIAASLGKLKSSHQTLVGFALETNDAQSNALKKLKKKNLDFIVLNTLQDKGAGFGHNTNKVTILKDNGECLEYPLKSKKEVAEDIVDHLQIALLAKRNQD